MTLILKNESFLIQTLKSCQRRFLSNKPRNRKWNLPPIQIELHSDTSSIRTSTSAKKLIRPQHIKQALEAHPPSKTTACSTTKPGKPLPPTKRLERWAVRKIALKQKFPEGWKPGKRLSPDAMEGIRILHKQRPQFTLLQLAEFFQTSPEAIRRILKSKWRPSPAEQADRLTRWNRRKEKRASAAIAMNLFRERSTTLGRYRSSHIFQMAGRTRQSKSAQRRPRRLDTED